MGVINALGFLQKIYQEEPRAIDPATSLQQKDVGNVCFRYRVADIKSRIPYIE